MNCQPITKAEARGNSRPISDVEYQQLAAAGETMLADAARAASPPAGLDSAWFTIGAAAYALTRAPWGGLTVDAHTGKALQGTEDRYALTVRPPGLDTVRVSESASILEFAIAMDTARVLYADILAQAGVHLGIFHDDDNGSVDIDPVRVVDTPYEVECIGAYTHAIGGAYHFATGDGYFPPHVVETIPAEAIA